MEQTQKPKIRAIMNNESTGPPASIGQQPNLQGDLNAFYLYQILALDSVVVKTQNFYARMEAS